MDNKISLIAFATCGNPYGFRQTFFGKSNKSLTEKIKTFDLNTNAIKLFPGGMIYGIRKESIDGKTFISYTIYTYAKEQNSSRGGTFIGSGIIFENEVAEENITVDQLTKFHESLVKRNTRDDIILVNHSKNFSINVQKDFDKINFNLRKVDSIGFARSLNTNLVVYSQINSDKIQQLLERALTLLGKYDTIYFTDNNEIAEFVIQKGLFKLVKEDGFNQEIQTVKDETKLKVQALIIELGKEKELLSHDKSNFSDQLKRQLEQNERLHLENQNKLEDAKKSLIQIDRIYDNYLQVIGLVEQKLQTDENPEDVQGLYADHKKKFTENINQLKTPILIQNISNPSQKINRHLPAENRPGPHDFSSKNHPKDDDINIYKIISLFLFMLLIGVLTYFLVFYGGKTNTTLFGNKLSSQLEYGLHI